MQMIYLSHPYTGDEENNLNRAEELAAKLTVDYPGIVFVNPLNAMRHMKKTNLPYEQVVGQCVELMKRCDAVIMTEGWQKSVGCCMEHQNAQAAKMKIYDGVAQWQEKSVK